MLFLVPFGFQFGRVAPYVLGTCAGAYKRYAAALNNHKVVETLHHKLLAIGMQQRIAMATIVCVSILFTLLNILLSAYLSVTLLLCLDVILWTAANIQITRKIHAINKN